MELGYILKTKQNKTKQTVHVKQWDETRHQSQQSFPVSLCLDFVFLSMWYAI